MKDAATRLILIVEDSREDYVATERALRRSGLANPLRRCEDGDDALDYLHRRGKYAPPVDAPRPDVILLDLNLPGTDGREVLAEIKNDPQLKIIPVIVLTTSTDERDIERCYREGANSYIRKPVALDSFLRAVQLMKEFWFEVAIMPRVTEE